MTDVCFGRTDLLPVILSGRGVKVDIALDRLESNLSLTAGFTTLMEEIAAS